MVVKLITPTCFVLERNGRSAVASIRHGGLQVPHYGRKRTLVTAESQRHQSAGRENAAGEGETVQATEGGQLQSRAATPHSEAPLLPATSPGQINEPS